MVQRSFCVNFIFMHYFKTKLLLMVAVFICAIGFINFAKAEEALIISVGSNSINSNNTASMYWNTNIEADCKIHYSVNSDLSDSANANGAIVQRGTIENDGQFHYYALLSGLQAGADYYYKINCTIGDGPIVSSEINKLSSPKTNIQEISNGNILSDNSIKINWTTDQEASCNVLYSANSNLNDSRSSSGAIWKTSLAEAKYFYEAKLNNLNTGVKNYYKVRCSLSVANISESNIFEIEEQKKPDLIISGIRVIPKSEDPYKRNQIGVTIKNIGNKETSILNSKVDLIYGVNIEAIQNCSVGKCYGLGNKYNASISASAFGKSALAAAETYEIIFNKQNYLLSDIEFANGTEYLIKAIVDNNQIISESDENNNTLTMSYTETSDGEINNGLKPDLLIKDIYIENNLIKVKYCNGGGVPVDVNTFGVETFYIKVKANNKIHTGTSDNSNYVFSVPAAGDCAYTDGLPIAFFNAQTGKEYSFLAMADHSQEVDELNENNNTLTKTIAIRNSDDNSAKNDDSSVKKDSQINKITNNASRLANNKLDEILAELKQLRDTVKEQQTQIKYLTSLKKDVKNLSDKVESALNNFITYGVDTNTQKLGAGERAAVIASYKSAFSKLPETEAELADAIKIANGRWPSLTNQAAENKAKTQFKKIYKRDADMNNAHDNAAVTVMAYGLRQKAENRNLNSEKAGIKIFKGIYGKTPSTTDEWNIMQAITYSGASR